jgi:plasmid stabilization system protein ParE
LTPRLVRFTGTAQDHVRREKAWWIENRTHTDILATELEQALKVLAVLPGAGTPYPQAGVVGLRRIYLRKVACHIYYTFDEHEVIVRALWGARRDKGPLLEP